MPPGSILSPVDHAGRTDLSSRLGAPRRGVAPEIVDVPVASNLSIRDGAVDGLNRKCHATGALFRAGPGPDRRRRARTVTCSRSCVLAALSLPAPRWSRHRPGQPIWDPERREWDIHCRPPRSPQFPSPRSHRRWRLRPSGVRGAHGRGSGPACLPLRTPADGRHPARDRCSDGRAWGSGRRRPGPTRTSASDLIPRCRAGCQPPSRCGAVRPITRRQAASLAGGVAPHSPPRRRLRSRTRARP